MAPVCRFSWSCCLLVLLVLPAVRSSFPRGGGSSADCGPGKAADCPGETRILFTPERVTEPLRWLGGGDGQGVSETLFTFEV